MIIDTEQIWIGLAWNQQSVEAILEAPPDVKVRLPIIVVGLVAADEEEAMAAWAKKYPHLVVDTVFSLQVLVETGAVG